MNATIIARTLISATKGKSPLEVRNIVERLVQYLVAEKRAHLLPQVLAVVSAHVTRATPKVLVASEHEKERCASAIAHALKELNATEVPTVRIEPSLVTGFVATASGRQIDESGKSKLIALYATLTA